MSAPPVRTAAGVMARLTELIPDPTLTAGRPDGILPALRWPVGA
jgi:hypothetical protein